MRDRERPVIVLSDTFATEYASDLAAAAPNAQIVRYRLDGTWDGDPRSGTVAFFSPDMWRTGPGLVLLDWMLEWPMLEWLQMSSAGVEYPSLTRLLANGVTLTNVAGVNSAPIGQHVLGLMLAHARRLYRFHDFQRAQTWDRIECDELTDAVALVVGLGGIGREVARLCKAVGMRVIGIRRRSGFVPDVDDVRPATALRDTLPLADYVVLACPLTAETRGLIDAAALSVMKPSAYLLNVARGPVIDTSALTAALRDRRIAGAALDVFNNEPLPVESPLWSLPSLTITPHVADRSPLSWPRTNRFFLANLFRYVRGEPLANTVSPHPERAA